VWSVIGGVVSTAWIIIGRFEFSFSHDSKHTMCILAFALSFAPFNLFAPVLGAVIGFIVGFCSRSDKKVMKT